ncbi:hypothetical protein R3P38DRAFT_3164910 [Favolaschia claudopus]|uniref:Uncharacterized protein n=1 Tax=Favolaschia claudopus TaxID=2862362 RepID=A0AAW0EG34_9AGAR
MKLPSSTSAILVATLAISSSSTTLAAPTSGDPPSSESRLTTPNSPSRNRVAARRGSSAGRAIRPLNMQRSIDVARSVVNNEPEARGLLDPLGSLLCPLVDVVVKCPSKVGLSSGKQAAFEDEFETSVAPSQSRTAAIQSLEAALVILRNQEASSYTPTDPSNPPDDARLDDGDDGDSAGSIVDDPTAPQDEPSSSTTVLDYTSTASSSAFPSSSASASASPSAALYASADVSATAGSTQATGMPARRDAPSAPAPVGTVAGTLGSVAGPIQIAAGGLVATIKGVPGSIFGRRWATRSAPVSPPVQAPVPVPDPAAAAGPAAAAPPLIISVVGGTPAPGVLGTVLGAPAIGMVPDSPGGAVSPVVGTAGGVGKTIQYTAPSTGTVKSVPGVVVGTGQGAGQMVVGKAGDAAGNA